MKSYEKHLKSYIICEPLRFFAIKGFKMRVQEVMQLHDGEYFICPGCGITLDRDFQNYCDRCGQHLDWSGYRNVKVIFPDRKNDI